MPTEILLFGLGAVGAVYAYVLNEAQDTRITVCARSNYEVVRDEGLEYQSERYGNRKGYKFHAVVRSPSDPSIKDVKFDYIVCANKAVAMNPSVSELIAPAVSENTTIALIQNGIGVEEEFRERFPKNTILSGVTWVGASQPSPGVIVHKSNETMQFGAHYSSSIPRKVQEDSLKLFEKLLLQGGTNVDVVDSIDTWRWKKTIWNCTWSTVTALTFCNTAQFLSASSSGPVLARAIMEEMVSIARASGNDIEEGYVDMLLSREILKKGIYSSMCMDAVASRPMEVDVIIAKPLQQARKLELKTPTLEAICALISALDWRFREGIGAPESRY